MFSYSDGAGNSYQLDPSSLNLIYIPVKATDSSSGTYDGGPSWSRVITKEQSDTLVATFAEAVGATDQQTPDRQKGTGAIEYRSGEKVILKMSSTIRKDLEAKLQAFAN